MLNPPPIFSRSSTLRSQMRRFAATLSRVAGRLNRAAALGDFAALYPAHVQWLVNLDIAAQGHEHRWQKHSSERNTLEIIAVTYRQPKALLAFLHSLDCQTADGFDVHVLHDGEDMATRNAIQHFVSQSEMNLRVTFTEQRYNDWGHSLRSLALEQAHGKYLLITNGDNYYAPRFVEFALSAIQDNDLDLLHFDMIHSHDRPGSSEIRSYQLFTTSPFTKSIDMGAFIVRTEVARRVGFRHRTFDADAKFLQDLIESGEILRVGHLDKVLLVHN